MTLFGSLQSIGSQPIAGYQISPQGHIQPVVSVGNLVEVGSEGVEPSSLTYQISVIAILLTA